MDWCRWHNGTVTDPKWRVIARRAGVPLHMVIAVWPALVEAANEGTERGTLDGFDAEDVAAALDLDAAQVVAVWEAMQGKVRDGLRLTGWEKRNPKREREDTSTERVRRYREKQATERHVTPRNATKHLEERRGEEKREEKKKKESGTRAGRAHPLPDSWSPDEGHAEIAAERGLDIVLEAAKLRDWATAERKIKADWDATFRNWLRRADPPHRGANGATGPPGAHPVIEMSEEQIAAWSQPR